VDLVGYPTPLRLALNPWHASAIHSIDRALFAGLFSEPVTLELESFLGDFDCVVAWCRDETGHLGRLLDRLKLPHVLCAAFPDLRSGIHASQHLINTLKPLGVLGPATTPELVLSDEAGAIAEGLRREIGVETGEFLALHPGSGSPRKNWSPAKFSALAGLAKRAGLEVVLIEGEADREPIRELLSHLEWQPPLIRLTDLSVLAALLSRAGAFFGNDSGITHLAAAAGAPTVAVFGPTDPRIWAPRGSHVRILPLGIGAEEVWWAIRKVWGHNPTDKLAFGLDLTNI
jgi:hypothetical protein